MITDYLQYGIYLLIVGAVAWLWLFLFKKWNILDRPGHDWIPPRLFRVPNFQGIVYIIWFWIALLLLFPHLLEVPQIAWLLYLATWYGIFNFINDIIDRKGDMTWIAPHLRLGVQILFVGVYVYVSGMYQTITIFDHSLNPIIGFFFCWFWILGFINAINFFDGVNGMTAGVTGIGYVAVAVLIQTVVLVIYQVSWADLLLMNGITQICILLAISCLVYIAVEYKPSGVMRDVGFSFIGFTLGALSLPGGAKFGTMLLVLFLPICDSIWVFINRVLIMKKNPMKGDYTHLHHRLMKIGFSRPEIRVSVWIFTLTMLLLLVLLGNGSIDKMVLFVRLAAVFFGLHIYLYWIKKIPFELIKKDKKQTD